MAVPPPPPGFIVTGPDVEQTPQSDVPPLPDGFQLVGGSAPAAAPPIDFSGGTLQVATPWGNLDSGIPIPDSMNAWLAGAGKFFTDKYRGAKQVSGGVANKLGLIPDAQMAQINTDAAQSQAPADQALMQDQRAKTGYLTAGVTTMLPVAAASVPAAAGIAAVNAALDPAASPGDRLINMGEAGAIGGATQGAMNAVTSRFVPAAADAFNTALARAKEFGMNVLPGQATGSPTLRLLERGMEMFPGSAGVMQAANDTNTVAANRVMANSIGQDADRITPELLDQAATNIGARFDQFKASPNPVTFSPDFFTKVNGLRDAEMRLPTSEQNPEVFKLVDAWAPPEAQLPGAVPQASAADVVAARSRLSGNASDAFKSGNSSLGQARQTVLDALDDQIQGSLTPDFAASYAQTRNQWRNLLAIQKAADPSGQGNPSLLKLGTALRQQNPQSWARTPWGDDDLLDLSRIGYVLKDALGNSGTAQREQALGVLGAIGGGAIAGHEIGGLPGAVAGAASPVGAWTLAKLYQTAPGKAIASTIFPGRLAGEVTDPTAQLLMGNAAQNVAALPSYRRQVAPPSSAMARLLTAGAQQAY